MSAPRVMKVEELSDEEVRLLLGALASDNVERVLFRLHASCGHTMIAHYPPPPVGQEILCSECSENLLKQKRERGGGTQAGVIDRRRISAAGDRVYARREESFGMKPAQPLLEEPKPDLILYAADAPKGAMPPPGVARYAFTYTIADGRRLKIFFGAECMKEHAEMLQRYFLERAWTEAED